MQCALFGNHQINITLCASLSILKQIILNLYVASLYIFPVVLHEQECALEVILKLPRHRAILGKDVLRIAYILTDEDRKGMKQ